MTKESEFSSSHDSSLRNKVFRYIKSHIISGAYHPGETLLESKLAEELGVSRTPIREAIRLLELEGLVEVTTKKGAVILGISQKDVQDIYAIRQLVEGLAGRWAAERISDSEFKDLQKTFELMEFYGQKQDLEEVAELDNKFHQAIYEASGSRILYLTLRNLHEYAQIARIRSLAFQNRLPQTLTEHRAILDALRAKDADAAEKALSEHVHNVHQNILCQQTRSSETE
ncbi:MAG TPA: GntR family transcriptional regulator [Selenomonadales bacterium]|nr:GntR family transcriptional regulator [Selenomonadales bacterium]